MDHDALETYLNDHLAGATLGLDHAKQLAERVPVVERLAQEIEEDRNALIDLMKRVDASENPVKKATAWVSEKAGRLKFSDDDLGTYLAEIREGGHGTEVVHLSRFRHRLRMSGAPIHYHVLVARRTA
jgi:hypothetical protein